jgi:hypothetical protein
MCSLSKGCSAAMNNGKVLAVIVVGILCADPRSAPAQQRRMQVVDSDQKLGVAADIVLVDAKSVARSLGPTDEQGYFILNAACGQGARLRATPKSQLYYAGQLDCPPASSSSVPVIRKTYIKNLKANASVLEQSGKTADAAMVWNELASRLLIIRSIDPKAEADLPSINDLQAKTIELFVKGMEQQNGHAIALPVRYDSAQKKQVLTPEFVKQLKEYQETEGVPVTGTIDYTTLAVQADEPISTYVFEASN